MTKVKTYCLYLALLATGASVLLLEILGTRILAPFFGSTIFVWSALITVTMACLALGYWFGGKLADKKPQASPMFLNIFLAGLFIWIIPKIDERILLLSDNLGLQWGPLIGAILLFGIPLFLFGSVSPYVIRLKSGAKEDNGKLAGRVFAIGTIGSLAGAILAGFILLPIMSLTTIFSLISLVLLLLAVTGLLLEKKKKIVLSIFVLAVIFSFLPSFDTRASQLRIEWQGQSFYGDIKVVQQGLYRCIYVDATAQTCLNKEKTTDSRYIQAVSEIMEQSSPKNILLLGFGGGAVLSVIPDNINVTAVELDPMLVTVAEQADLLTSSSNLTIHYDDARHWLRNNQEKFDLIVVDVFKGENSPVYMFTTEALADIKNSLSEDGLVFFHTVLFPPQLPDKFLLSVNRGLEEVFGSVQAVTLSVDDLQDTNFLAPVVDDFSLSKYTTIDILSKNAVLATDNFNPLGGYYLPYLIQAKEGVDKKINNLYFVK